MMMCSRFFIKLMTTPYTGPSAKAPSKAGRSEKSILTKDGMSIGSGNSMNIRIKATALSMAATVRLWVVFFFMVVVLPGVYSPFKFVRKALFALDRTGKTNQKAPCCNQKTATGRTDAICLPFLASGLYRWSRSCTGSAPLRVVADFTASGELHPALKRTF